MELMFATRFTITERYAKFHASYAQFSGCSHFVSFPISLRYSDDFNFANGYVCEVPNTDSINSYYLLVVVIRGKKNRNQF